MESHIILNSKIVYMNDIYKKNKKSYLFFIFSIYFIVLLIPSNSDQITQFNIKFEQNEDGYVEIYNRNSPIKCPTKLKDNGEEKQDTCNPYLTKGNHTIYAEWDYIMTDLSHLFRERKTLVEVDLSLINTTNIERMVKTFRDCISLRKVVLPNITSSSLIEILGMFEGCISLTSVEFTGEFTTKNVNNTESMFKGCKSLVSINFPNSFDTSNANEIKDMFSGCISLISLNFKIFDLSKINNTACFFNSTKISNFELDNFDTSQVTDMEYMFNNCSNLISLNISMFNYSNIKKMDYMLANNINLEYINFGKNEIYDNVSVKNIFENCPKKTIIYVNKKTPEDFFHGTNATFAIIECGKYSTTYIKNLYNENKIICIQNCKYLNNYKFKYKNRCYISCPNNTIANYSSFICESTEIEISTIPEIITTTIISKIPKLNPTSSIEEKDTDINIKILCNLNEFLLGRCKNFFQNREDEEYFAQNIINNIMNGNLNEVLSFIVNEEQVILIPNRNKKYQISTISGQKNLNYSTSLDFRDCENELKVKYSLNLSEELILFKIENNISGINIPIIDYVLFNNNGSILLDLNKCNNLLIDYSTPISLDKNELYKYNLSSEYYSDICKKYSNGDVDMTIYDRKYEYNDKNMSLCEYNCTYVKYDINISKVRCKCPPNNGLRYSNNSYDLENKQLLNKVVAQIRYTNFDVTQCINLFTSKDDLKSNSGFYTLLFIIAIFIIIGIIFCLKGYRELNNKIDTIIYNKFGDGKNIKKFNIKGKEKNPPKKYIMNNNIKLKVSNNFNKVKSPKTRKNNKKNINKKKQRKISASDGEALNKKNNSNSLSNIYDNDYELNTLSFDDALKYDKRKAKDYYCSLLIYKQIIIYSFFNYSDYTSGIIKKFIFFLTFAFHYGVNALFFNDIIMHKIYEDEGSYNILYQISFIFYSSIICIVIIRVIMETLIITEKNILDVKKQKTRELAIKQKRKSLKCIMIKYTIFFITCSVLLTFFWIYLTCFSAVYQNTQTHLIINTVISFVITLAYPFVTNIIPLILRKDSLYSKTKKTNGFKLNGIRKSSDKAILKNREYIYNISKYFQVL